uniref:Geranyl diphosphate synthase small subunit n=1 Tax=Clarkia breweri TaxID=36903 RepID=Q6QLU5_CLABR|nr:geranyl diphosphate synthase small subunit [Clarkia breweri]
MLLVPLKPNLRHPSFFRRKSASPTATMATLSTYWDSINDKIDGHLKAAVPVRKPLSVFEPLHHLTLAAPRSSAPALCIAACELVGGSSSQAMDAAAALHLIHASLSVHKRLYRGGSGSGFGSNIELLTGDGMLPLAFELLANSEGAGDESRSRRILRVIVEISKAAGSEGLLKGEYNELQLGRLAGFTGGDWRDAFWMDHVCGKKEGGLHACAAACGGILGGGTEEEIEKLRKLGYLVGMIRGIVSVKGGAAGEDEEWMKVVEEMAETALKLLTGFSGELKSKITNICQYEDLFPLIKSY